MPQAVDETNKKTTKIAKVQDDEHSAQGSTDLNTLLQQFQYVVDLQELIVFEGRLWSLYHLLTIVCLSVLMWSRFSKQILRVPHLQCSKIISEILCRHISNFKSLIVVVG